MDYFDYVFHTFLGLDSGIYLAVNGYQKKWGGAICRNVGNISVLNHEGEPMDIKQARVCTRVYTRANFVQDLCR